MPRAISTQLIKQREVDLVTAWSLHSCVVVSLVLGRLLKEIRGHQSSHKILIYRLPCLREMLGQRRIGTCGSDQPRLVLTGGLLHKREPMPNTAWMVRSQRLDSPESYGRTQYD